MRLFKFGVRLTIILALVAGLQAAGPALPGQASSAACPGNVAALRTALAAANAPGSTATTITLDPGCTYSLVDAPYTGSGLNALPVLTTESPITINGNGAILDLSGASISARFFEVGSGASLTLNNLTLNHGGSKGSPSLAQGGAVRVDRTETVDPITLIIAYRIGRLTLNAVILSGCAADQGGAIYSEGALTLNRSEVSGTSSSGGTIYTQKGSLIFQRSSIHDNTASGSTASGAGIVVYGPSVASIFESSLVNNTSSGPNGGALNILSTGFTLVTDSYFEGNSATAAGGAVSLTENGSLLIANSTFYTNTALQGAALYTSLTGTTSVLNSTLVSNAAGQAGGGSLYAARAALVKNTIVGIGSNGADCAGVAFDSSSAHNLDSAGGCGASFTQRTPPELALGAPQLSFGPTKVIPLLTGSAAIDAGDPATCAAPPVSNHDQRGQLRPRSGVFNGAPICDIGAFEYLPVAAYLPIVIR
jgi:hypothetical protein